jgi:predicted lipoprotein with Yx(FWY)xxD motif
MFITSAIRYRVLRRRAKQKTALLNPAAELKRGDGMKKLLVLTIIAMLALGYGCTQPAQEAPNASANATVGPNATVSPNATANNTPMPGSDRDAHGCIPSAGYVWCDASQKCIRPWEENCTATQNVTPMPGSDRDSHGCIPSAGYMWCDASQKCIRPWEENCSMSYNEARQIAQGSACMNEGNLTNESVYNNITMTWWLGMDTVKPGCSPACVVYGENRTAEINWRCTGLIAPAPEPVLQAYQSAQYGQILTGANGMTLYVYANDQLDSPTCLGTCARNWPPLVLDSGHTTDVSGLPGMVGTVERSDGVVQVTYNRMPLYFYAYDSKPGDALGNGVKGVWYTAVPGMTALPSPQTQSSGGGY